MNHYIFNESGSIPGIPGTFANCRVDIDDQGNLTETPLAHHPAFEAAHDVDEPTGENKEDSVAEEKQETQFAQETAIPEQTTPAPYSKGG